MRKFLTRKRVGLAAVAIGGAVLLAPAAGCVPPPYGGAGMGNGGHGAYTGFCASHNC